MPAHTRRQMPKWTKAPPELVARFAALLEGVPDTQTRKMLATLLRSSGGTCLRGCSRKICSCGFPRMIACSS